LKNQQGDLIERPFGTPFGKGEMFDDVFIDPKELDEFEAKFGKKATKEYLGEIFKHISLEDYMHWTME
jgi:hypothetical protein